MDTIIVTPKNKEAIPFLKHLLASLDDVKSIKVVKTNSRVAKSIEGGLKDVKDILDGKKSSKTLKQLLDED
jgi:hypothetical protein